MPFYLQLHVKLKSYISIIKVEYDFDEIFKHELLKLVGRGHISIVGM